MLSGVVMYFVERCVVRGWLDRSKRFGTTLSLLQPYVDQTGPRRSSRPCKPLASRPADHAAL